MKEELNPSRTEGAVKASPSYRQIAKDPERTDKEGDLQRMVDREKTIPAELFTLQNAENPIPEHRLVGDGQGAIKSCTEKAQTIHKEITRRAVARLNGLLAKMRELQEEKYQLKRAPYTRKDLLKMAKEELRKQRDRHKDKILRTHLDLCQQRKANPFTELSMSVLFRTEEYWQLAYLLFEEKDVERIIKELPDIGISLEDREAKNKELDRKILSIKNEIDKEYAIETAQVEKDMAGNS